MRKCNEQVEEAIRESQRIREAIEDLAKAKEAAVLKTFGLHDENVDSSDDTDESCSDDEIPVVAPTLAVIVLNSLKRLFLNLFPLYNRQTTIDLNSKNRWNVSFPMTTLATKSARKFFFLLQSLST